MIPAWAESQLSVSAQQLGKMGDPNRMLRNIRVALRILNGSLQRGGASEVADGH